MKSKDSPNLYEILRSAARTSTETAPPEAQPAAPSGGAHEPTLQERLAIYKAAKMGLAAPAPGTTPSSLPLPSSSSAPVASASPPEAVPGLGERVLQITYNTAAFLVLVTVGLLFVAYSLGVRAGRSGNTPEPPAAPPAPASMEAVPAPARPPAPSRTFTLRLAEWPYRTAQERLKANAAAEEARRLLARSGLAGAETVQVIRGSEPYLALRLGRYSDPSSGPARSALAAVQKVMAQNQAPFAKAQFEEISLR